MKAHKTGLNVSLANALAMLMGLLVCIAPADASAQPSYTFANGASGWQYMGLYDGGGLTPLDGFIVGDDPWTNIDGDSGAILMGQEGFTPRSPTPDVTEIHGDLNSPMLAYRTGRTVRLRWDITGSHMMSTKRVWVQAVLVVRAPKERSDRYIKSGFYDVPIGADGAWDTHTHFFQVLANTLVKQINLRIFVETDSYYKGWIMVDNVSLN
jgi:hypothetical protein